MTLKTLLLATAATVAFAGAAAAADVPRKLLPPPPPPPMVAPKPVFSWAGAYIGAFGGYAWGSSNMTDTGGSSTGSFDLAGPFAGGEVGADMQWGPFVAGIVADGAWADISGSTGSYSTDVTWFGTGRARLGIAADRVLFYGTGGVAFGGVNASALGVDDSSTRIGWVAGGGVEVAFGQGWSVKAEYLHVDLGNESSIATGVPIEDVPVTFDLVKGGVAKRF